MPLYLVTNVCNDGLSETSFRVVEAPSRLAVAEYILRGPGRCWSRWLERSQILDRVEYCNAEQLLARIDSTHVDGDSYFQFAIHEIVEIERVSETEPAPSSRS